MSKILSFIILSLASSSIYALDFTNLASDELEKAHDISYIKLTPRFEEKLDPKKAVQMEFFFAEYDDSPESQRRIEYIKQIIKIDKATSPKFKMDLTVTSALGNQFKNEKIFQSFANDLELGNIPTKFNRIPAFEKYTSKLKNKSKSKREPSALMNGRNFWTLVRGSLATGGTFAGLYLSNGLSPMVAASIAIWPGLASGAFTYFSGAFGDFVTKGKWSKWIMNSETYFAKNFRKIFKLNDDSLKKSLVKNRDYFKKKWPKFYKENPKLFKRVVAREMSKKSNRAVKALNRLTDIEEYFRWWVTEVAFTAITIKIPQTVAGISVTGLAGTISDIFTGSLMGMAAQGFGDLAVQIRKYQQIEELKEAVKSGKLIVENKTSLLKEIDKILAKEGTYARYRINRHSHSALQKIENIARAKATAFSFLAVTGVGFELAGVPGSSAILIGTGSGGVVYYSAVKGWIKTQKITTPIGKFIARVAEISKKIFFRQRVDMRLCGINYKLKALRP